MVQNLSAVGTGYAQATGYFSASLTGQVGSNGTAAHKQTEQKNPDIQIISARSFSSLNTVKDNAAEAAKAIREASKTLDKAETLLNKIEEQVGLVKNYPPYPPGNEERVEYIKGLEGLRKEIDALVVPKVDNSFPPVFYPRESEFPELDAKVPSDAAVLAFGDAVQAVKPRINAGREELRAQAELLSARIADTLPTSQAEAVSVAAATQIGATSHALTGNSGLLVQLGG